MLFGWIDRRGEFYECGLGGHREKCDEIKIFMQVNPEEAGWIKITKGHIFYTVSNLHYEPTNLQMKTLYNLCKEHDYMHIYKEFIQGFYSIYMSVRRKQRVR